MIYTVPGKVACVTIVMLYLANHILIIPGNVKGLAKPVGECFIPNIIRPTLWPFAGLAVPLSTAPFAQKSL